MASSETNTLIIIIMQALLQKFIVIGKGCGSGFLVAH